jgi:hypothetical protein
MQRTILERLTAMIRNLPMTAVVILGVTMGGACAAAGDSRLGMPVEYPDFPVRTRTYGLLAEDPVIRVVEPGRMEVTFVTEEPTPPAMLYFGVNTLDEELDYPRFRQAEREEGETTALLTRHRINFDFKRAVLVARNTPIEPRITYRVEVFVPKMRSSRFFEGRAYYDPATFGDAVNVTAGPFVEQVTRDSAILFWETDRLSTSSVRVGNAVFASDTPTTKHETRVRGLEPGKEYEYRVSAGNTTVRPYSFRTDSGGAFKFVAMVDSREGFGGGEINFGGVEARALTSLLTDAYYRKADFVLVAGDLIGGYVTDVADFRRQLNAFRQVTRPVHARIPVYESMGNHEALLDSFSDGAKQAFSVDKRPPDSAEDVFAAMFCNPTIW